MELLLPVHAPLMQQVTFVYNAFILHYIYVATHVTVAPNFYASTCFIITQKNYV